MKFKAWMALTLLLMAFNSTAFAGQHVGERKQLDYFIEYASPSGFTGSDQTADSNLWGLPLYFQGETMRYRIHIQNNSNRTFNHLRVIASQEYFLADGAQRGALMPGNATQSFFVPTIQPFQEIVLNGSYEIGTEGFPGFDQTHLMIEHWASENGKPADNRGRVIIDDPTAGLWCPPGTR